MGLLQQIQTGRSPMPPRIEVYGTKGTAIHTQIGSPNLSLCLETATEGYREGWQDLERLPSDDFPTLLRELSACIRGEKEPDYTLPHDMTVQRVLFHGCGIPDGNALKPKKKEGPPLFRRGDDSHRGQKGLDT